MQQKTNVMRNEPNEKINIIAAVCRWYCVCACESVFMDLIYFTPLILWYVKMNTISMENVVINRNTQAKKKHIDTEKPRMGE